MNKNEILEIFRKTGALLEGHFQLTSGLHSGQYFQCAKVLQYPEHAELLCGLITKHFSNENIQVVIAPAIGGIIVGQEVARLMRVRSIFTERHNGMMMLRRGFTISPGERVLVCEDVITTGGSVNEVIDIVKNNGGNVIGVGVIVDRSGGKSQFNNLYATLTLQVETFPPDNCPLCKNNLPIAKPGSRESKLR